MKTLLALLLSMSILTACQQELQGAPALPYTTAHNLTDVSYGKDSLQQMDVYLPAGRNTATTKSIVLIHGGGWNGGNKADFATYIRAFKKRMPDYAIFNINYRLVNGGHLFPSQEEDVKAALKFITDRAGDYGIHQGKIVLLGASAGAHLALLQAYKYTTPKVAAVIDFFGPTDLTAMYQNPWHPLVPIALQMVTGTSPQGNAAIYRQSSPATFVSSQAPPTLIFHGAKDQVVNISQSRTLHRQLEKAGIPAELVVYPNESHGWWGHTLQRSFDKMEAFLKEHVR